MYYIYIYTRPIRLRLGFVEKYKVEYMICIFSALQYRLEEATACLPPAAFRFPILPDIQSRSSQVKSQKSRSRKLSTASHTIPKFITALMGSKCQESKNLDYCDEILLCYLGTVASYIHAAVFHPHQNHQKSNSSSQ